MKFVRIPTYNPVIARTFSDSFARVRTDYLALVLSNDCLRLAEGVITIPLKRVFQSPILFRLYGYLGGTSYEVC